MVLASQLRSGMVLKVGDDLLKVVESTYHVGQGKMPGSVHAKLRHVRKGALKEQRWRPEEKQRAQRAVRELKQRDKPVVISIRGGVYYLSEPITFRAEGVNAENV